MRYYVSKSEKDYLSFFFHLTHDRFYFRNYFILIFYTLRIALLQEFIYFMDGYPARIKDA